MNNKENNLSELRKKLINTIDLLQEILDIANESEDSAAKMSECNETDLPKKPDMRHWASRLPDSFWDKHYEGAVACGDAH